jgi:hypothetical protein
MSILRRIFPDSVVPVHVVSHSKDGLMLSNGFLVNWPDDETGVVLLFDAEGNIAAEWWPDEKEYQSLMNLFKVHPGKHDIIVRHPFRVVGFDEDEQ